jgi:uncharacterized phage protein (TIGR01671 family)
MREILFRGKRWCHWEWKYGSYAYQEGAHKILLESGEDEYGVDHYYVDHTTVGQFTGLTDKNGTKIFEGDIGKYKQTDGAKRNGKPIICIGKVVYNTKTASFAVDSKDDIGAKNYDYFPIKDFEVIGNIHDNPELLEG